MMLSRRSFILALASGLVGASCATLPHSEQRSLRDRLESLLTMNLSDVVHTSSTASSPRYQFEMNVTTPHPSIYKTTLLFPDFSSIEYEQIGGRHLITEKTPRGTIEYLLIDHFYAEKRNIKENKKKKISVTEVLSYIHSLDTLRASLFR
jgi:hypothetical protein